ncbi:hypothetical protein LB410_09175 [Escherichia coli]
MQRQENEILINGKNTKINFKTPLPFYHDVIDITPIYSDAILLEEHKLLVPQESIPNICYLLQIPSTKEGVVVENHNFGYHFHYCKVKKRTLERTNLLLTFDPVFKKKIRNQSLIYSVNTMRKGKQENRYGNNWGQ